LLQAVKMSLPFFGLNLLHLLKTITISKKREDQNSKIEIYLKIDPEIMKVSRENKQAFL